ncbi:hypothetical protein BKA24_002365 [Microbacterium marinum]|uniref:Uncharacterized protein n=1 Tax=Microbacterium marinum TaxID=421115 RepID=A0A7W7FIQ3_9MICO|nr:hypothetical protein [Microbacterium marinum]MBB4667656.1 hypothetical protein [Microbacterium marinum]
MLAQILAQRAQRRDRCRWRGVGDYQILIGYRGVIDEMSVRRGVEVTYRVGFMIYHDTLPAAIIMCPADQQQACLDEMDRLVEELGDAE